MAITVNIYYSGKNGNARRFAEEMLSSGARSYLVLPTPPFFPKQEENQEFIRS